MIAGKTETPRYSWDDVFVLNPRLGIRPDSGRALLFTRDPIEFRRGLLTTERAILTALMDGRTTLRQLAGTVKYLFDYSDDVSNRAVDAFMKKGLSRLEDLKMEALVNVADLPPGQQLRQYDPQAFARAGSAFSTHRKLLNPICITWMPSANCAVDCIYCYACKRPIAPSEYLSDTRIREVLQEIIDLEIPIVSITGGDPFTHPRFLDYLEIVLDAGIGVELPTKTPLTQEQVSRMAAMKLPEIQISIDGPNAEIADFMIQTPGWFDRIIQTIRMLVKAGVSVRTNTILTPYNIAYAEETARLLAGLGVRQVKLTNYSRSMYRHSEDLWVRTADAERLLGGMAELRSQCPSTVILYNVEKDSCELTADQKQRNWPVTSCTAFVENLVICPDGNCVATEEMIQCQQHILGNVKHDSIQEVWNSERFEQLHHPSRDRFKGTVCYECEDYERCHYEWGYCFRDAYKAYGSLYAPTPSCPKAPPGLRLQGTVDS